MLSKPPQHVSQDVGFALFITMVFVVEALMWTTLEYYGADSLNSKKHMWIAFGLSLLLLAAWPRARQELTSTHPRQWFANQELEGKRVGCVRSLLNSPLRSVIFFSLTIGYFVLIVFNVFLKFM